MFGLQADKFKDMKYVLSKVFQAWETLVMYTFLTSLPKLFHLDF